MDPILVAVIAGAVVAGFVQGLSGFAFGMVAMAFWAWLVAPQPTMIGGRSSVSAARTQ